MPDSGKNHSKPQLVCRINDLLVTNTASGLDNSRCTGLCGGLYTISKWEKSITRYRRTIQIQFVFFIALATASSDASTRLV